MTTCLRRHARSNETGMSLIELMLVTLVGSTMFAISVPAGRSALDSLELGSARQEVGLALQTARLRAVSANRPMRLRLNCPGTGQFRVVEVTGVTSTDSSATRCDISTFGYPGPRDSDPAVGQIEDATGPFVMMVGSGFLATPVQDLPHCGGVRAGSTFYLIDVGSGAVHDSFDVGDDIGKTHLKNALHADPTATGPPDTRFVDMIYIGDTEGSLWRFGASVSGGVASLSSPVKIHDAGQEHPLYGSLATVTVGGPVQYVFFATGVDILPTESKLVAFSMVGVKDDRSQQTRGKKQFQYKLGRKQASSGDERPTSAPAVAGDVVFFTTTTEFPLDPCRCPESALYALTYDGNQAYNAGTGGITSKKGKTKDKVKLGELVSWEGRATAPFIADQHLYFGTNENMRVFGDPEDFNNGASAQGVRITSWREIRR